MRQTITWFNNRCWRLEDIADCQVRRMLKSTNSFIMSITHTEFPSSVNSFRCFDSRHCHPFVSVMV